MFLKDPANLRLVKIACYGGLFVSVSGYYMKWRVDARLRSSDYYLKAVAHLKSHKPLVEFLGEPIKFKNVNLSDTTRNYTIEDKEANFEVPLTGTLKSGIMHFKAVRTPDVTPTSDSNKQEIPLSWKIVQLEVSVHGRPGERVLVPIKSKSLPSVSLATPAIKLNVNPITTEIVKS